MKAATPVAALSLIVGVALASHAFAHQTAPPSQSAPGAPGLASPGAEAYTDAKLRDFANAIGQVQSVEAQYAEQLAAAGDGEAGAAVRQEVAIKMGEAVQGAGLTPAEYNEMMVAAEQDPDLRQRVLAYLQPAQGGSAN